MTRGRPRQALLSRDLIVETAITQLDAGKDLSLSRIARELSVHVSSLYNHVVDRDGLIELMREYIAAEYPVPPLDGLTWQDAVREVATTIRTAFVAHPKLVPLLAAKAITSEEILGTYEGLTQALLAAGFTNATVSLTVRLIDVLTLGSGADSASDPRIGGGTSQTGEYLRTLDGEWATDRDHADATFSFGVELIVDSLERELEAPGRLNRG